MHSGKNYSFKEVLNWTRKDIFLLLIISSIPTILYILLGWKWLTLPWLPIALLGTAVAFIVGFKNNASYDRVWEARKTWGAITNGSRSWAIMTKDYISNKHAIKKLTDDELKNIHETIYNRHYAWLTALRFQLREARNWEAIYEGPNKEYKDKWFTVDEHSNKLEDEIKPYLSELEFNKIINKTNKATQIIALQSAHLKQLLEDGLIEDYRHMELEKILVEFYNQQGASERIKNFPYPRQYATLNMVFVKIFIILIPFGMLQEFEKLGVNLVWLTIPFSTLSGWVFTVMEKIGEASENPFEGSANDVPITAISRAIEIDMNEILGIEHNLLPLKPINNILT